MNKVKLSLAAVALAVLFVPTRADAQQILGSAATFGVLGGTTVTSTGATVVTGDVGVNPGTSITGFGPGVILNGAQYAGGPVAGLAQQDLGIAYGIVAGETPTQILSGQDLGGMILTPGVYKFGTTANLAGILTLDSGGDPNARFDFQIGTTLITDALSQVVMLGGPALVYWQVGSSATLGTETKFIGNIMAFTSITLNTGSTITDGSALAQNGAVTLDTNQVTIRPVPEPMSMAVLGFGLAAFRARRKR